MAELYGNELGSKEATCVDNDLSELDMIIVQPKKDQKQCRS